ncbi:MAG: HAMP domain-containing histidine kinase [Planctomycetes bacterium]|nr:HAMP domain-containing histidine kinase [Planctomycetota bacterium]
MLFSHWPIRNKLQLGLGLLAVSVLTLFGSAYYGLYAYRGLVKSLSARSAELPLANKLRDHVADLHEILNQVQDRQQLDDKFVALNEPNGLEQPVWDAGLLRQKYSAQLDQFCQTLDRYRAQLENNRLRTEAGIGDDTYEQQTLDKIDDVLKRIQQNHDENAAEWLFGNEEKVSQLREDVETLRSLAAELPSHLHERFRDLSSNVRTQYRWAISLAWMMAGLATILLVAAVQLFRKWIARPLATLVEGSREVAAGKFDHRIHLDSSDEMGELAVAMNAMTARFRQIRDDLDCQVRERTKQVVRSEQLASVGYLAAGVAHEINNPLASIAMCSESLESRLSGLLQQVGDEHAAEREVVRSYLEMIQKEAFRCKQITEKLLDFSRMGDSDRHNTDLRELAAGVIEMLRHLGKYQNKNVVLHDGGPVIAEVSPQEVKQVVLNLVTNGLDSVEPGGTVTISVSARGSDVQIVVEDNGCGMTEDVVQHLFEPFFTRRRGGQGTGLGLSITYRIVEEHHGQIVADSGGLGKGSRFIVTLPLRQPASRRQKQPLAA